MNNDASIAHQAAEQPSPVIKDAKRGQVLLYGALLLCACVVLPFYLASDRLIETIVANGYMQQLRIGHGLVFNVGDRTLLVPTPAYLILGALFGTITVYIGGLLLGGWAVFRIAQHMQLPPPIALIAALAYLSAYPVGIAANTALPLASALLLLTFVCLLDARPGLAGVTAAVAMFCHPLVIAPCLALLLWAAMRGMALRFLLPFVILVASGIGLLLAYYGIEGLRGVLSFRPVHPIDPSALALAQLTLTAPWLLLAGIALVGIFRQWRRGTLDPIYAVCGAWLMLGILTPIVFLHDLTPSAFAPTGGILVILLIANIYRLREFRVLIGLACVIVPILAIFFASTYRDDGLDEWQQRYLTDAQTIGFSSLSQFPDIPRTPDQTFISFDGALQPDLQSMRERDQLRALTIRYAPDVLMADSSEREVVRPGDDEVWQTLGYALVPQTRNVYRRTIPIGAFIEQPVDLAFGPDLMLQQIAIDQTALKHKVLRLRLDWQAIRSATQPINVMLTVGDRSASADQITDRIAAVEARQGRFSSYHLAALREPLTPTSAITITLKINGGTVASHRVSLLGIN